MTWGKTLTLDQVRGGGLLWQTDVFFATLKKKLLITFFSTGQRQGFFGSSFLLSLECRGFFPFQLKTHSLGDIGPLWVKFIKSLGRQPHHASFGLFGRKGNILAFDNAEFSI